LTIRIVALGGTVNPGSTTEQALRLAAGTAAAAGTEVQVFGGNTFPPWRTMAAARTRKAMAANWSRRSAPPMAC